jgi:hypothetical protein
MQFWSRDGVRTRARTLTTGRSRCAARSFGVRRITLEEPHRVVSAEKEYAKGMTGDYLKAVAATLAAMRRIKSGEAVSA